MYWDTETLMEKNGYHRYEISNYAKEDMPAGTTWDIGREFRIWDLELVRHLWFPGI